MGSSMTLTIDLTSIGNKLHDARKKKGYTQGELAELAGISDRAYADIERGNVNMRVTTLLNICNALQITPDDILTDYRIILTEKLDEYSAMLELCSAREKETALELMRVYIQSLGYNF